MADVKDSFVPFVSRSINTEESEIQEKQSNHLHVLLSVMLKGKLQVRLYEVEKTGSQSRPILQAFWNSETIDEPSWKAIAFHDNNEEIYTYAKAKADTLFTNKNTPKKMLSEGAQLLYRYLIDNEVLTNLKIHQRVDGSRAFRTIPNQVDELQLYSAAISLNDMMVNQYKNQQIRDIKKVVVDVVQYYMTGANKDAILDNNEHLAETDDSDQNRDLDVAYWLVVGLARLTEFVENDTNILQYWNKLSSSLVTQNRDYKGSYKVVISTLDATSYGKFILMIAVPFTLTSMLGLAIPQRKGLDSKSEYPIGITTLSDIAYVRIGLCIEC